MARDGVILYFCDYKSAWKLFECKIFSIEEIFSMEVQNSGKCVDVSNFDPENIFSVDDFSIQRSLTILVNPLIKLL